MVSGEYRPLISLKNCSGVIVIGPSIDSLICSLKEGKPAVCESVFGLLSKMPGDKVVPEIAELLFEDLPVLSQGICLDLLEYFGAVVDLNEARADDWFEKILEQVEDISQVSDVVGREVLAFSMILGVRICYIRKNDLCSANTTIEFTVNDSPLQTLTAGEFKAQVIQTLLAADIDTSDHVVTLPLEELDAIKLIGHKRILLAPLFGISLRKFIWVEDTPLTWSMINVFCEENPAYLTLSELEELINQKLKDCLRAVFEEPIELNLKAIELAKQQAQDGDDEGIVWVLRDWYQLFTNLQRIHMTRRLTDLQLDSVTDGFELLADVYTRKGQLEQAEEIYKLCLRFIRDEKRGGIFFFSLAKLLCAEGRWGEAISFLRRSVALGVDENDVYPLLARALLQRGKTVGAALLLEQLANEHNSTPSIQEDIDKIVVLLKMKDCPWPIWGEGAKGSKSVKDG